MSVDTFLPVPDNLVSSSAGKKGGKIAGSGDKKRKRKTKDPYEIYIYKVLKQEHPDLEISKNAMSIINSFVNHMCTWISGQAIQFAKGRKKVTVTVTLKDVEEAVQLILPGRMAKYADECGIFAIEKEKKDRLYIYSICIAYLVKQKKADDEKKLMKKKLFKKKLFKTLLTKVMKSS